MGVRKMKIKMKNVIFLLAVMLMIFARSLSAQIVLNINGNVSDMNGSPIANHDVYFTDDTTGFNIAMAITNANGDYSGVFTASPNTPIGGILFVATEDCNFNMVLNTHAFTSTTPLPVISDFIICNSSSNPCSLGGASVNNTPNGLSVSINGGTPPYTYIWSNGTNGYWSQFYQNWCVTILDANGCDTTICDSTSSSMNCQAGFQSYIIGFNPNAVPVMVQFNDLSLPQGSISSWLWDFGDGTTDNTQNPVHAYQVPGVYYACLTITANLSNGTVCTSTYCDSVWADTISIGPPPSWDCGPVGCYDPGTGLGQYTSLSSCQAACGVQCNADFYSTQVSASDTTFFFNTSSGTTTSTSYFWDFGDGDTSIDENPRHLYTTSGWYYVCLTIIDSSINCYDTYCDYINIVIAGGGGCQAYFYGMPSVLQLPNTYDFFDYSSGNVTNWLWDFGDGTTSTQQNPTHTYANTGAGFYLVCLTVEEYDPITQALICTDNYCDSIYLMNQPSSCIADFYAQDLGNNEAIFTNLSYPQTGTTWFGFAEVYIDFGDGTNALNIGGTINHTYPNDGTYYVCVEVVESDSSGNVICTDFYCDSVTVTSGAIPCQANFCWQQDSVVVWNPNGGTTGIMSNVYTFCDLSTPVGMIQSWQWDMGDNGVGQYLQNTSSSSQIPIYEFDTNGVYNVCLTIVTMGGQCTSTTCDSVDFLMMQGQTSVEETHAFETLKLYPNPANDKLTVNLISNTSGKLYIRLVNMVGQTLSYEDITIFNGAINHSLDISEIKNGIYSVEVVLNGEKQYQRLVISR